MPVICPSAKWRVLSGRRRQANHSRTIELMIQTRPGAANACFPSVWDIYSGAEFVLSDWQIRDSVSQRGTLLTVLMLLAMIFALATYIAYGHVGYVESYR